MLSLDSSGVNCSYDPTNSLRSNSEFVCLEPKEARKAASVDPTIRRTAVKTAESYEGRAPTKTDIFTEGNAGTVISFKCWIGSSVTVPSL